MNEFYNRNPPEEWEDIHNYENLYQVSNYGRVRSKDKIVKNRYSTRISKGKIISPFTWGAGYKYVNLRNTSGRISKSVHRLVAETFIKNQKNKPEVNHKDGDKSNNSVWNLEWCTSSENEKHAYENGMINITFGQKIKCTNIQTGVSKEFASCDSASEFVGVKKSTISCALKRRGGESGTVCIGKFIIERI